MKKYTVIDGRKDGNGDVFQQFFDTLEEANAEAENQWEHLVVREQKERTVFVAIVDEADCEKDEEGNIEWASASSLDWDDDYFNSEKL
ncbi:hypothetical protein M2140_000102 [Clostridiales Family XIII bacterium PM5-7]